MEENHAEDLKIKPNKESSVAFNSEEIIKMSTDDTTNKQTDETFNKDIVEMNEESVNETTENHKVNCLFCNIIATNDPDIILEPQSDQFVIIRDIQPVATNHFLILSREHIQSAKDLQPCAKDQNLLKNMIKAANEILINNHCDLNYTRMGFHWPPFYTIAHIHLHAISPVNSMSLFNRFIAFNPSFSYVFVDVKYVQKRICCEEIKESDQNSQSKSIVM